MDRKVETVPVDDPHCTSPLTGALYATTLILPRVNPDEEMI